ncbi:hypothetical protein [uncultured Bifidobacterium sp.]|uniref:hypothetical protein n=1 Tax=uncultured Bifidobacterium sp. TaxID=165187 RepID=UPI0025865AD8|nr:hypothetical protein [uncultured Bifidobacterium sp.]
MMRIIERYCRGERNDQSLNEDGMLVTDDFAAVVDGVTSKSVRHLWRPSGGVVAKDLMIDIIGGMPADASMRQMQRAVDARFQARYRSHEAGIRVFADEPVERLQANAVVYSARRHEAWLFGDCQIMVNGVQTPTTKDVDVLLGDLRAFTVLALREMQDGTPDVPVSGSFGAPASDAAPKDPSRAMILPFLRLQSQFANKRGPFGYFVFDGFTDMTYPIRTVPVSPGDEVVQASDGYPLLRPTLDESERELQRLRSEDPDLIDRYRSTKGFQGRATFDDLTYLRSSPERLRPSLA